MAFYGLVISVTLVRFILKFFLPGILTISEDSGLSDIFFLVRLEIVAQSSSANIYNVTHRKRFDEDKNR